MIGAGEGQAGQAPKFSGYEILESIGAGGMGVVYKARVQASGEVVVLKVPQGPLKGSSGERFRREAEALKTLKHPNIVRLRHFETGAQSFYAMDLVDGRTLKELLSESQRLGLEDTDFGWLIGLFKQLAEALRACQAAGLQHRDVKPENIILTDNNERVVLVDFGLVAIDPRLRRETYETLTRSGQILGTPGYMAPEQLDNSGELGEMGPATDVWGFGATLYKALTGQTPFGHHRSFPAWAMQLMESEPEPVESLNPKCPRWLAELCGACLRKRPEDRPGFAEVLEALECQRFRSPWPRLGLVFGAVGVLVLLSVLLWASQDRDQPALELAPVPAVTGAQTLKLEGRLVDARPAYVLFGRQRVPVDSAGHWLVTLDKLKEGAHEYQVLAVDEAGKRSQPETVRFRVDRTAPHLKLEELKEQAGQLIFKGFVSEPNVTLSFEGQAVALKGRFFHFRRPWSSLKDLTFKLADSVGNVAEVKPEALFVVGGRYASLRAAIKKAPSGGKIVLGAGRHRVGELELDRDLQLLGRVGQRQKCELVGRLKMRLGVRLELKSLSLVPVKAGARILELSQGARLDMTDCQFRSFGDASILAKGTKKRSSEIKLQGCQLAQDFKSVVRGRFVKLYAEDCDFVGVGTTLMSAEVREGLLQLEDAVSEFQRCRFSGALNNGVRLVRSTASLADCLFEKSGGAGLHATDASQVRFERCRFVRNLRSGLQVWARSSVEVFDCRFINNGSTRGRGFSRFAVVLNFSRAKIHRSLFERHEGEVVVNNGRLEIRDCQFKDEAKGRFVKTGKARIDRGR